MQVSALLCLSTHDSCCVSTEVHVWGLSVVFIGGNGWYLYFYAEATQQRQDVHQVGLVLGVGCCRELWVPRASGPGS